jgi:hypothetical protein
VLSNRGTVEAELKAQFVGHLAAENQPKCNYPSGQGRTAIYVSIPYVAQVPAM